MKLVVGLGNPGEKYYLTRHNVGFLVLDNFLGQINWQKKKEYYFYKTSIENEEVIFIKPTTFMNLSGKAVKEVVSFYKIDVKDILVIRDDIDLNICSYRIKQDSSAGGHNGIKNIINELKSQEFSQLKIGVGKKDNIDICDYVLSKLCNEEIEYLQSTVLGDIIKSFIKNGYTKTMNDFNGA